MRLVQLERLRVSSDWDWMRTCDSLGQPYRSRWASLGQAVGGDMTALLMLMEPLNSCGSMIQGMGYWIRAVMPGI